MKHLALWFSLLLFAVYSPASGKRELVLQLAHRDEVIAVAPAPDGNHFASLDGDNQGSFGDVKIWTRQGELFRTHRPSASRNNDAVTCVAWRDANVLIAGKQKGSIELWDIRTGSVVGRVPTLLSPHSQSIQHLAASRDGSVLAAVVVKSEDKGRGSRSPDLVVTLTLWRMSGGYKFWKRIALPGELSTVKWAVEGRSLFLTDGVKTRILDVVAGKTTLLGNQDNVCGARDGALLAFSDGEKISLKHKGATQKTFKFLWDYQQGDVVTALALSPDGNTLVAGIDGNLTDSRLVWFDTRVGRMIASKPVAGDTPMDMAFTPDGKSLIIGGRFHHLELWSTAKRFRTKVMAASVSLLGPVVFSPNGRYLVHGGDDGTLRVWDVVTRKLVRTINEHEGWIDDIAFSRDSKKLASLGSDGITQIWDMRSYKRLAKWQESGERCVFAADSNALLVVNGTNNGPREVRVWNASTGKLQMAVTGHGQNVNAASLSPDGKWLATAASDGLLKIWNLSAGVCEVTLKDDTLEPYDGDVLPSRNANATAAALAWSSTGDRLVIGGKDSWLRVWNFKERKVEHVLRSPSPGMGSIQTLRALPGEKLLVSYSRRKICEWNLATGSVTRIVTVRTKVDSCVDEFRSGDGVIADEWAPVISPDGRLVMTYAADGGVTIADVATGNPLATFLILPAPLPARPDEAGPVSQDWVTYTPEGKINASVGAKKFIRWRVNGKLIPAVP